MKPPTELPANQIPVLVGISSRVSKSHSLVITLPWFESRMGGLHHIAVIKTCAGDTVAS